MRRIDKIAKIIVAAYIGTCFILSAGLAVTAASANGSTGGACGNFDTALLRHDLKSGYYERSGMDMAKATMAIMAMHLDCERAQQ